MNMKTRLLGMMAILVSIFAMTACQKDKADDTWKQLPVGQISVKAEKPQSRSMISLVTMEMFSWWRTAMMQPLLH